MSKLEELTMRISLPQSDTDPPEAHQREASDFRRRTHVFLRKVARRTRRGEAKTIAREALERIRLLAMRGHVELAREVLSQTVHRLMVAGYYQEADRLYEEFLEHWC